MKDGRGLSSSSFQDGWERSLRRETALQDEYRRAICTESGGLADTGFDRWNAASCLQEQFDSARGVEITRRLAKSRAIDARFSRRSLMKDLQGDELEAALANTDLRGEAYVSPPPGRGNESLDDETSPTRGEALERFGIDLGRVGAMTTARTNSRQSLAALAEEESPKTERSRRARHEEDRKNSTLDRRQKEENRSRKRNRGGTFARAGKGNESAAAKEKQEHLTEKLRELNVLLSNEPWSSPVISCVPSKQEFSVDREKMMPKYLVPGGSVAGPIGGCTASTTVVRADENMDGKPLRDVSPRQKNVIPVKVSAPEEDLPRLQTQGLGTTDVATVDGQELQGACVDVERASQECVQTGAPVVPRLNIDCRSSTETLSPKEDTTQKLDAKGLPNHRPCWWWMPLLASGAEGISIPDTVTLAPTFLLDESGASSNRGPTKRASAEKSKLTITTTTGSCRVALLWAFSGSGPAEDTTGTGNMISKKLGGLAVDGELSETAVSSSRAVGPGKDELEARREQLLPTAVPLQRLHTQVVAGDGGLLCAARAICESGRRGGGEAGGDVGGGERSKLPLALLKIWGRESEEERGRQRALAGEEKQMKRRGRRLRVVSLWTETEVLEALRDMAKGKWGRPARDSADTRPTVDEPTTAAVEKAKTTATTPSKPAATATTPSKTTTVLSAAAEKTTATAAAASKTMVTASVATSEEPKAPTATSTSKVAATHGSGQYAYLSAHNEDACCVQAFVKSARYAAAAATAAAAGIDLSRAEVHGTRVPGPTAPTAAMNSDNLGGPKDTGSPRAPLLTARDAAVGVTETSGRSDTFQGRSEHISGGCRGAAPNPVPGTGRRRRRDAAASFCGPVFYRALWRRTGKKLFVWKVTSRYPYMSNLASHLCPLVGAGSFVPFMAVAADGGAFATAADKTGSLVKALQQAYDPTLQRLWADWAVNEVDGQWFLVEVHGLKTDTDVRKAAAARKEALVAAAAQSQVHAIHFCGDPDDLQARIAAANPTQEICLVEMSKRLGMTTSKRQPRRPRTPSKISQQTRKKLARRGAAESRKAGPGTRRMTNQYWRCAGDFCETRCGEHPASATSGCDLDMSSGGVYLSEMVNDGTTKLLKGGGGGVEKGNRGGNKEGGGEGGGEDGGGGEAGGGRGGAGKVADLEKHKSKGGEVDDVVGRRKHALSVETPRTVLFRLVLNARAALLGYKASAADFSQMEKPVQLCSACYTVCAVLDRERTERTRRAMEAEENSFKAGKARRSRRPHGWKSRMQHELEDSLGAERHTMHRLMDNFNAAAEEHRTRPTPRGKSISNAPSEVGTGTAKRGIRRDDSSSSPRGERRRYHGRNAERALIKRMDAYPIPPVHEYGAEAKTEPTPRSKGKTNALSATKTAKRAIGHDDSSSSPRGERRRYRGREAERALFKRMDAYPIPPVHEYGAEAKAEPTSRNKSKTNALFATKTAKRAIGHDDSSSSPRGERHRGRDAERTLVKRMDAYPMPPVRDRDAEARKTEALQSSSSTAWSTPRQNAVKKLMPQKPSPIRGKTEASFVPKPPRPQPPQGHQQTTAAPAPAPAAAAGVGAGAGAAGAAGAAGETGAPAAGTISISGRRVKQMQGEKLRQQQQQEQQEHQRKSKRDVRARRKAKERARRMDRRRGGGGTEGGEQSGSTNDEDSDENESAGGLNGGGRGGRRTRKGLPLVHQPTKSKSASLRGAANGKSRWGAGGKERSAEPGRLGVGGGGEGGVLPPDVEVIWNDDESYEEAVARTLKVRANKMRLEAEAEEALGVSSKDHELQQQQDSHDMSSQQQDQDSHDISPQYGGDGFEDDVNAPTPPR